MPIAESPIKPGGAFYVLGHKKVESDMILPEESVEESPRKETEESIRREIEELDEK